eukprot:scaffold68862_cov65-Phaeocystis_antarctica.AAC.2
MTTSEEALQQAQAEKLTLLVSDSKTGYYGVSLRNPGNLKPYQAKVWRGGKDVHLGHFATAEEAALCVARSPEGQAAAAQRAAAAMPLTSEEARQQARAGGLTLRVADNKTGYFGVNLATKPGLPKPYQAQVWRGGKNAHLGSFATAEEAALCIARSLEGQAVAAERAAEAAPLKKNAKGKPPAMASGAILNEECTVQPMPSAANRWDGLFLLEEHARRACFLLKSTGRHDDEGEEQEVESSNSRPKRYRSE